MFKKIGYFFELGAYALGVLGGFGWSMYGHGYLIGVCVLFVGVMAYPKARDIFKKMME